MTDFGEILKTVGDFGRFQKRLLRLISLACPSIAFHMFGQLFMERMLAVASEIYKYVSSPSIGRRPVTLLSMLMMGAFGVGAAFAPNFYVYMALRCLMVLTGLAYGVRNWKLLQISGSAPMLGLLFYIWVLPESACWLVMKGKIEEAKTLLQKAASVNKQSILPELLDQMTLEKKSKSGNILDLFRKLCLRKTLIICYAWFVNSLVYLGLSLNVGIFGLNVYLTQLVFGAVEIPAHFGCIFLLQWFGRKKCQGCFLVLGGAMCLIITCIPKDLLVVVVTLAVIGKFAIAASLCTSYVYCAELFPTVLRQTSLGLCSMSSRVGDIVSPLICLLDKYHPAIPMVIFGSAPVIAGILCFLLRETRGKELQDYTEAAVASQR
ncbi:solute carrier family 22 member 13-like [Pangshura tecta]